MAKDAGAIQPRRLRSRVQAWAGTLRDSWPDAMAKTGGGAEGAATGSGRLTGVIDMVLFSCQRMVCWTPP